MAKGKFDMSEFLTPVEGVPESDTTREIAVNDILDNPLNFYPRPDNEKLAELMESIQANGMLEPPTVVPAENGKYRLISGHSRMNAVRLLASYTSASSSSRKKCSLSQIRKSLPNRSSATRSCIKCIRKRSSEKMRPDRLLKGYAQRPKAGSQVLKPAALTVLVPSTGSNAITSPSLILREIQCAGRSLASALMTAVKKLV